MKKILYIEILDNVVVYNGYTFESGSKPYTSPIGGHKVTAMGYINNAIHKEMTGLIKTKASLNITPINEFHGSKLIKGLAKTVLLIIRECLADDIEELVIHSNSVEIGFVAKYALTNIGDRIPLQNFTRNPFEDITSITDDVKFIMNNDDKISYSVSSRYGFERTHVTEFFSVSIGYSVMDTVEIDFKTFWKKPKTLDPRLYGKYVMVDPKVAKVSEDIYKVYPLIYEEFEQIGVEEPSNMISEYVGKLPDTLKRIVDAYLFTTRTETPFVILLNNVSGLSRKMVDDFGVVIPSFDLKDEMTLSSHFEELATTIKPIGLSLLILDFIDEINNIKSKGTGKDITDKFIKNKKCLIGMKDKKIKVDDMIIFLGEDIPDRGYIKSVEKHIATIVLYELMEGAISRYVTVITLNDGSKVSCYSPTSSFKPNISYTKIPKHSRLERVNRNKPVIDNSNPFAINL